MGDSHFPSKLNCPDYLFSILLGHLEILSSIKHVRVLVINMSLKINQ